MNDTSPLPGHSMRSFVGAWVRTRRPTREAIVVSAMLALLFGFAYLAAFFVRSELLLRLSDARTIISTIVVVVLMKTLVFYWFGH
ncbi:MAG: hypothetical protein ACK6CT_08735, partial [Planctomycetia bacterium]